MQFCIVDTIFYSGKQEINQNYALDDGGHVFSECTLEGTWTKPNINCYFDPIAAANNLKKVSLDD